MSTLLIVGATIEVATLKQALSKAEAQRALQEIDAMKKIAAVRHSICKASM